MTIDVNIYFYQTRAIDIYIVENKPMLPLWEYILLWENGSHGSKIPHKLIGGMV